MSIEAAREHLKQLDGERRALESLIEALTESLTVGENAPGLQGNLVDKEVTFSGYFLGLRGRGGHAVLDKLKIFYPNACA